MQIEKDMCSFSNSFSPEIVEAEHTHLCPALSNNSYSFETEAARRWLRTHCSEATLNHTDQFSFHVMLEKGIYQYLQHFQ